ncbi:hypothetical protein N0M98_30570 [Paenibacillus doosanensis]|uniref:Uncharacterized protein n=1 Tax=Paenibacillus konkukensis TaxID=2020716 RepID=A0ABY4RIJ6_9BACL|nr:MULTISPECIES: hypothetical protein [Paenibacillus]MCS7464446.1 hypothetical protein [Paenibacillus doosanensis]UQZ81686.1 hypothetical protein SK3146_00842 [Paenibacillus konkukensis]
MEERDRRIILTEDRQIDAVARLVAAFAAIVTPRAIVFCDDEADEALLAKIADRSTAYIPREHMPMLMMSNWRRDYLTGLQHLALNLMITECC